MADIGTLFSLGTPAILAATAAVGAVSAAVYGWTTMQKAKARKEYLSMVSRRKADRYGVVQQQSSARNGVSRSSRTSRQPPLDFINEGNSSFRFRHGVDDGRTTKLQPNPPPNQPVDSQYKPQVARPNPKVEYRDRIRYPAEPAEQQPEPRHTLRPADRHPGNDNEQSPFSKRRILLEDEDDPGYIFIDGERVPMTAINRIDYSLPFPATKRQRRADDLDDMRVHVDMKPREAPLTISKPQREYVPQAATSAPAPKAEAETERPIPNLPRHLSRPSEQPRVRVSVTREYVGSPLAKSVMVKRDFYSDEEEEEEEREGDVQSELFANPAEFRATPETRPQLQRGSSNDARMPSVPPVRSAQKPGDLRKRFMIEDDEENDENTRNGTPIKRRNVDRSALVSKTPLRVVSQTPMKTKISSSPASGRLKLRPSTPKASTSSPSVPKQSALKRLLTDDETNRILAKALEIAAANTSETGESRREVRLDLEGIKRSEQVPEKIRHKVTFAFGEESTPSPETLSAATATPLSTQGELQSAASSSAATTPAFSFGLPSDKPESVKAAEEPPKPSLFAAPPLSKPDDKALTSPGSIFAAPTTSSPATSSVSLAVAEKLKDSAPVSFNFNATTSAGTTSAFGSNEPSKPFAFGTTTTTESAIAFSSAAEPPKKPEEPKATGFSFAGISSTPDPKPAISIPTISFTPPPAASSVPAEKPKTPETAVPTSGFSFFTTPSTTTASNSIPASIPAAASASTPTPSLFGSFAPPATTLVPVDSTPASVASTAATLPAATAVPAQGASIAPTAVPAPVVPLPTASTTPSAAGAGLPAIAQSFGFTKPFESSASGPGATPTATTPAAFATTITTTAAAAASAAPAPLSFAFGSGSPAPGAFSFGAGPTATLASTTAPPPTSLFGAVTPAPTFGASTSAPIMFGSTASTGFGSSTTPAAPTAPAASAPAIPAFGSTPAATSAPPASSFSFGGTASSASNFTFGSSVPAATAAPASAPSFALGAPMSTGAAAAPAQTQPTGFGSVGSAPTGASNPPGGFSFGGAGGAMASSTPVTPAANSSFTFGADSSSMNTSPATSFGFGSQPLASAAAPATGFGSFGSQPTGNTGFGSFGSSNTSAAPAPAFGAANLFGSANNGAAANSMDATPSAAPAFGGAPGGAPGGAQPFSFGFGSSAPASAPGVFGAQAAPAAPA
ncbi:uncharacterized protein BJ171DRAFT_514730, partial [Polychytrium aggregatum]|uniref:uncharacterized protein n=1 Tax=Polychytrium aggregatum TaxID=110093 RepID=UPI0022FE7FFF